MYRWRRLVAFALVGVLILSSCSREESAGDLPNVVVTTSILGDIVRHVVGSEAKVEVLIGFGVDPHEFAPSPQQAALVASATVVVANGLGLEDGLIEVLENAREGGTPVIWVGEEVDPVAFGDEVDGTACVTAGPGLAGDCDPHFWMDPIRVGAAAVAIADALEEAGLVGGWHDRALDYQIELADLDQELRGLFETIDPGGKKLVTNHDSLGYLARRYGFTVLGVIVPGGSTLGEPSSADLARLVETIEREQVRAIFVENTESAGLAMAVASELDDPPTVVELFVGSLGGEGSGVETLSEMLLVDAARISQALK